MATELGVVNFNGYNGSHFYLKLTYDIVSQDTTNCSSTIRYYAYIGSKDGYSGSGTAGACTIQAPLDGQHPSHQIGTVSAIGVNSEIYVGSYDVVQGHNTITGQGSTSVAISASFSWSGMGSAGFSIAFDLPTIPRAFSSDPTITVNKGTNETSFACSWTTSEACNKVEYSLNNGSSWTTKSTSSAASGSFSITGLTANTTYDIQFRFTRQDSSIASIVSAQQTTYAYPYISAITPVAGSVWEMSGTSQTLKATVYNPLKRNIKAYVSVNSTSGTKVVTFTSSTGTSFSSSMTKTTANNAITTSKSANLIYWCEYSLDGTNYTASGTTVSNTYQLREADCKPTISNFTYTDGNSTTLNIIGDSGQTIVQNYGIVKATVGTVSCLYNATPKTISITLGSKTVSWNVNSSNPYNKATELGKFNYPSGSVTMTATVTDSRGWTASVDRVVTFISYQSPKINVVAQRTGGYGTNATFTVNASYSNLPIGGTQKNAWLNNNSAYVRYKITPTPTTPSANGNVANTNPINKTINITGADNDTAYTITIYANDKISSATATVMIGKGQPILSVIKDNQTVGVNIVTNESDSAGLYVNGVSNLDGDTTISGNTAITGNTTITGNLTNVTGTAKITGTLTTAAISSSGQIKTTSTTASSSTTTGSIVTSGGIGAAKNSYFGGNLNVAGTLTVGSKTLLNWIYPVGSVYISVNTTNPGTLFGGTWERIKDKFLLASGDTYPNNTMGGAATHKHLTSIGFDEYNIYGYATPQVDPEYPEGEELLPAYGSKRINNKNRMISSTPKDVGDLRVAYTDEASTLPPYLTVYVWKRTA